MAKKKNYDGMRFNNFVVIKRLSKKNDGHYDFLCKCDCGKEFVMNDRYIHKTKSCGCGRYAPKPNWKPHYKHYGTHERLYRVWCGMRGRCNNPNYASYKNYGGRGIKVCDEWENSYAIFREWSLENGYNPNAGRSKCTIDRIDVNGNYEPSNCRWVDNKTQANNKRSNHYIEFNGEIHTLQEWAEIIGIKSKTLSHRFCMGWSIEKALTTPIDKIRSENRRGIRNNDTRME